MIRPTPEVIEKDIQTMYENSFTRTRATTILAVRKNGRAVMAGDGQVSIGDTVMKHKANKLRFMYKDNVLVGLLGRQRMPSISLRDWRGNLKNSMET